MLVCSDPCFVDRHSYSTSATTEPAISTIRCWAGLLRYGQQDACHLLTGLNWRAISGSINAVLSGGTGSAAPRREANREAESPSLRSCPEDLPDDAVRWMWAGLQPSTGAGSGHRSARPLSKCCFGGLRNFPRHRRTGASFSLPRGSASRTEYDFSDFSAGKAMRDVFANDGSPGTSGAPGGWRRRYLSGADEPGSDHSDRGLWICRTCGSRRRVS